MLPVPGRAMVLTAVVLCVTSRASAETTTFTAVQGGEAIAVVRAQSPGCRWGRAGAEAAVLRVDLDDRYSQHLVLVRGDEPAEYRIALGVVEAGPHRIELVRDDQLSAMPCRATIERVSVDVVDASRDEHDAAAFAPILHARPDAIGRFTDTPILMYVETGPAGDGREYRYTVAFTNEDGGTPADRLMATWGRTVDIEFVYGVRTDARGRVVWEEIQATGHEIVPFTGAHEGRHPLLWVATDNNMVEAHGTTRVRMAPAAEPVTLGGRPRETVLDRHPWTYRVMADELAREGRIDPAAEPGTGRVPDLSSFVFLELCAGVRHAALALSIGVDDGNGGTRWFDVDRGVAEFRLARSGCNRVAVPVSRPVSCVSALRARASEDSRPEGARSSAIIHELSPFVLDEHGRRTPLSGTWRGERRLEPGGDWEIFRPE